MSQRLPALVGMAKARELSYTARTFTGAEAAAMGMACRSVSSDELDATVTALAAQVVESSAGSLAAYKDLYGVAESLGIEGGLAYEYSHDYEITDTDERLAGFR
jgi:enoyl-CoA hydratase/carnithine racemase